MKYLVRTQVPIALVLVRDRFFFVLIALVRNFFFFFARVSTERSRSFSTTQPPQYFTIISASVICLFWFVFLIVVIFQHGRSDSYRVATVPYISDDNRTVDGKPKVFSTGWSERIVRHTGTLCIQGGGWLWFMCTNFLF